MKLLNKIKVQGQHEVSWSIDGNGFNYIKYGAEKITTKDKIEAAHKFGECLSHANACAGNFDK